MGRGRATAARGEQRERRMPRRGGGPKRRLGLVVATHATPYIHTYSGPMLLGLNLLKLLKENRVSEFFTEYELIPAGEHGRDSQEVQYVMELQAQLIEGKYEEFLESAVAKAPASAAYRPFLSALEETAREEIARCISVSYKSLSLGAAAKLLMLGPGKDEEAAELLEASLAEGVAMERGGGSVTFAVQGEESKFGTAQRHGVIKQALGFAEELERVV